MTPPSIRLFDSSAGIYEASFVERPNRFLVRANLGGAIVDAHCPNPSRLLEIFIPGAALILQKRRQGQQNRGNRKPRLKYSLIAARHRGVLVPMPSAWANDLTEAVVLPILFPDAATIRREISLGSTRLDFLLGFGPRKDGKTPELFLEVKNCSLIEEGTAMFPDAPTTRGLKHLGELEALAAQERQAGVLFLLMNPWPRRFVPNLHTDPAFARKLISLKGKIWMRAVSIRIAEDGTATVANPDVPIDLAAAAAVQQDSGAYLLIIRLRQKGRFTAGSLGEIRLEAGWYVYAGSGRKNLSARIARHHRRRKKLRWHVDFLLACVKSGDITSLPVRSSHDLECPLARAVAALAAGSTPGFGCTDCSCTSHLFHFAHNPLENRRFLDLLLHYRHTVALDRCSWEAMSSASQG